jgi:hypothetical protein
MVIKCGGSGYKFSVWKHDARAFLTDLVDEKCGKGHGMGIWVQLGPKFLLHHINNLHEAVKEFLTELGVEGEYPIRITRIDLAVDLLGASMVDQDISLWCKGWVGRSKVSSIILNSRTGKLETFYIGSRKSPVYLRIYDKVAQAKKEGDIEYWQDVWKGFSGSVVRVEWEVKTGNGFFADDLRDFSLFTGFSLREFLNYLLEWGKLCIPDLAEENRTRWGEASFWKDLREVAQKWLADIYWPTSRFGKEFHGISEAYIKQLSGTISGGMARINAEKPNMVDMFEGMAKYGETLEVINKKASAKAAVIINL